MGSLIAAVCPTGCNNNWTGKIIADIPDDHCHVYTEPNQQVTSTGTCIDGLLVIAAADLDFGEIPAHAPTSHRVEIQNSGTEPLSVSLTASCQCTAVTPDKLQLAAGARGDVTLTISPPPPSLSAGFKWPLSMQLVAQSSIDELSMRNRTWRLAGHATRRAYPDPLAIALTGPNEIIQGQAASGRVTLRTREPLAELKTELTPNIGDVLTALTDDHWTLDYHHRGVDFVGDFSAIIKVTPITRTGEVLPSLLVPVEGTVVPPFRLCPSELVFPPTAIGSHVTAELQIHPLVDGPFELEGDYPEKSRIQVNFNNRPNVWSAASLTVTVDVARVGARAGAPKSGRNC
jgi:hypothetical protein